MLAGLIQTGSTNLLELLHIPGRQRGKDQHAEPGEHEREGVGIQEDVDDPGNNHADQRHERQVAHGGQVAFGQPAVERHHPEGAGGGYEHAGDRGGGVDQEDEREGDAVERGVEREEQRRHERRDLVDGEGNDENERELEDDGGPEPAAVGDFLGNIGLTADVPGDARSQQ